MTSSDSLNSTVRNPLHTLPAGCMHYTPRGQSLSGRVWVHPRERGHAEKDSLGEGERSCGGLGEGKGLPVVALMGTVKKVGVVPNWGWAEVDWWWWWEWHGLRRSPFSVSSFTLKASSTIWCEGGREKERAGRE